MTLLDRLADRAIVDRCPPMWLRHLVPWWLIYWTERRVGLCRCGIVMWKLGYDEWPWHRPKDDCFCGPTPTSMCYCGKFRRDASGNVVENREDPKP